MVRPKDVVSSKSGLMQPPSRIARTQSVRRPAQDGISRPCDPSSSVRGIQQPTLIKRTTSTIVKEDRKPASPAPNFGLQRSGSVRVPSPSPEANEKNARNPVVPSRVTAHSRTSSVNPTVNGESGLQRSASIARRHARSQSSSLSTSSRLTATTSSTDGLEKSLARPTLDATVPRKEAFQSTTGLAAPSSRPNFNTLQQHYSPAKTSLPKPPVPSSRTTVLAEDKMAPTGSSFETTKLQSELLYLSLLHQSAGTTLRSYEKSARSALHGDLDKLQLQYKQLRVEERKLQEQVNLMSLADWSRMSDGKGMHLGPEFAENIQRLSGALTDMAALTAGEGRYSELVQVFSTWIADARTTTQAREMSSPQKNDIFVAPLPLEWHQSHALFTQKLRLLEREVEMLPPLPSVQGQSDAPKSALNLMLETLQMSTTCIKEELDVMVQLEKQTLEKEKLWVEDVMAGLSLEMFQEKQDTLDTAWRTGA